MLTTFLLVIICIPACSYQSSASPPVPPAAGIPAPDDSSREKVVISGKAYPVPQPWAGNRLQEPQFDFSDFRRIPVAYTHEGSELYILAAAHQALVALLEAAEQDGIFLKVESAYRSKAYQKRIFKRMLDKGRTFEDIVRYVAPPGYSEHMLGMAVDFFPSNWRFADTAEYTWLRENSGRFGFEETYSRTNPLKMPWEAWHWNFTGEQRELQAVSELSPDRSRMKSD